ncbi:MAG: hypothetical protein IPH16_10550 [Haliscomenobacter sp.]|nr:hypothetical protein [Haliscomenobacter sp.]
MRIPSFRFWVAIALTALSFTGKSQSLDSFPENPTAFANALGAFLTANKSEEIEKVFKAVEPALRSGVYPEAEFALIRQLCNQMKARRLTPNPHFKKYLELLPLVKQASSSPSAFQEWHEALIYLVSPANNRMVNDFSNFLSFSSDLFEKQALRSSDGGGVTWRMEPPAWKIVLENGEPALVTEKTNLIGQRLKDSIRISETQGRYYPLEYAWKGLGGKVSWERIGLPAEVYVELDTYALDSRKGIYTSSQALLSYPLFLGQKKIKGVFSDKVSLDNTGNDGFYPRFESLTERVEIKEFGEGIRYSGGFRLEGKTVYGVGARGNKPMLEIYNRSGTKVFKGVSNRFTIRQGEQLSGEQVEAVFYSQGDSIYHPSVNIRFAVSTKELRLYRGELGSGRIPFVSSVHQVNIEAEEIIAYLNADSVLIGKPTVSIAQKKPVLFESLNFFQQKEYEAFQGISSVNPVALIKVAAEKTGTRVLEAEVIAKNLNSKYTAQSITKLLYDLAAQGFINYDSEKQLVEVKDKVFNYVDASRNRIDYDALRLESVTDQTNAIFNLKNKTITIKGVKWIPFSTRQKVAMIPDSNEVVLREHRNLDFAGTLQAGFSEIKGKNFRFNYQGFQIQADSIDRFRLFAPDKRPSENPEIQPFALGSDIERFSGVLLIDAENNKSGKEDIPLFPSLNTKGKSFVFYDGAFAKDTVYQRSDFYFELEPFHLNQLDNYVKEELAFPGKLRGARIESEDFIFRPRTTTGSAREFALKEVRDKSPVPQVNGADVQIDWRPYADSMYVSTASKAFDLFQQGEHSLTGRLILTPGGLKGEGTLDWPQAAISSPQFSFGAFSVQADTMSLQIKALDKGAIAIQTDSIRGNIDFEKKKATFRTNQEFLKTGLPFNQYETSMNEFDWDMSKETVTFKSDITNYGTFTSSHPEQDTLSFQGRTAFYDLKTYLLQIGEAPYIKSADAFIYPDSGRVEIQPGGAMTKLENATIVCDTIAKNHKINRASVQILGRKEYRASGFYEFNIGSKKQEIAFTDIRGTRVGKGAMSQKATATLAEGQITQQDSFLIDTKTSFYGLISLGSESANLKFDGFARLESEKLPERNWFNVNTQSDKSNLAIPYSSPKTEEGIPLETGLFLSKEIAAVYPRVMMPLYFRKDRPVFPAKGVFRYDKAKDQFIFGDSSKVLLQGPTGNQLVFQSKTGRLEAEGKFNLGSGLKYYRIDAAGTASTQFLDVPDSLQAQTPPAPVDFNLIAGLTFNVPEKLLRLMQNEIASASFATSPIAYLANIDYYKKGFAEIMPPSKELQEALNSLSTGVLGLPKKDNTFTLLFSGLNMRWDMDYQSLVSRTPEAGLISILGDPVNQKVTCYAEFKMPSNDDDRVYFYLKLPNEIYYYYGYRNGILELNSNDNRFMDEAGKMKSSELVTKTADGETYEIQIVEASRAQMFLRRAQAAGK